ncbi:hypothetical protein ICE98_02117 [Lactococcus lactis]|nr:hypothetical protein [Lactococcus lactis]
MRWKIDLNYQEKIFKNVYAEFLETSHQRLTELEQKNRELNLNYFLTFRSYLVFSLTILLTKNSTYFMKNSRN